MNQPHQKVTDSVVRRLWNDDAGALLAAEWLLIATILVIGLVPGLVAVREGALDELTDLANAVMSLDQSYSFCGSAVEMDGCNCERRWVDGRWVEDPNCGNRGKVQVLGRNGSQVIDPKHPNVNRNDGLVDGDPNWNWHNRRVLAYKAGSQFVQPAPKFIQRKSVAAPVLKETEKCPPPVGG
jgi:hypothetical protein